MAPNKEQVRTLSRLLREFHEFQKILHQDNPRFIEFVEEDLVDPLHQSRPEFHRCRIELLDIAPGFPIAHRNEKGHVIAVQLRPITADQIQHNKVFSYATAAMKKVSRDLPRNLLLGCGNNPTSICYHYPTDIKEFERTCREYFDRDGDADIIINQHKNDILNNRHHHHSGYITIDPNIVMNPTLIAEFGEYKLPFLPSNHFSLIESEGIYLEDCKYYQEEEKRLLINKV